MKLFSLLDPQRQRTLLALFASGLLFWCSIASMLPTLPLYVADLGGTQQQVGLVMGAFAIGLLASRRGLGNLADRRSRKLVLVLGTGVATIAPLGYLFIRAIPFLIVLRAFHGISIAAFTTAYSALVTDTAPPDRRGELIGYMSLVNPLGVAIGPAVGGFLQTQLGYPPLFLLAATLGGLSFWGALQIVESSHPHRSASSSERRGLLSLSPRAIECGLVGLVFALGCLILTEASLWMSVFLLLQTAIIYSFIRQIFTSPQAFRVPTIVMLMVGSIFGTITMFMPLFLKATEVDLNPGWFYTAAAISSFSMRVLAGRASDRLGRGLFISFGLVCYGISMLVLMSAQSPQAVLIAGLVEGMAAGIVIPMMVALMSDRSQAQERGRIFSLCIGGFDLGLAISGPILGAISESLGYRNIFAIATGIGVLALTIFVTSNSKDFPHSLRFALGRGRDIYAVDRASA